MDINTGKNLNVAKVIIKHLTTNDTTVSFEGDIPSRFCENETTVGKLIEIINKIDDSKIVGIHEEDLCYGKCMVFEWAIPQEFSRFVGFKRIETNDRVKIIKDSFGKITVRSINNYSSISHYNYAIYKLRICVLKGNINKIEIFADFGELNKNNNDYKSLEYFDLEKGIELSDVEAKQMGIYHYDW